MSFFPKLLGFILIFFLLDRGAGIILKPYYDATRENFSQRFDAVVNLRTNAAVIFTGNSQTRYALDPDYIAAQCTCQVANVSINSANMITTYYLLNAYLQHNTAPRLVVLQTSWEQIARGAEDDALVIEKATVHDQPWFQNLTLDKIFKTLAVTYQYRPGLVRFLQGDTPVVIPGRTDNGFLPHYGHLNADTDLGLTILDRYGSDDNPYDRTQVLYFDKIVAILRTTHVAFVMIQPPESFERISALEKNPRFDRVASYLVQKSRDYHVPYFNFNTVANDLVMHPEYFFDKQHLNTIGAAAYSAAVWKTIAPFVRTK